MNNRKPMKSHSKPKFRILNSLQRITKFKTIKNQLTHFIKHTKKITSNQIKLMHTCNSNRRIVILGLYLTIGFRNQTFLHFLTKRTSHLHSPDSNIQFFRILFNFLSRKARVFNTFHYRRRRRKTESLAVVSFV